MCGLYFIPRSQFFVGKFKIIPILIMTYNNNKSRQIIFCPTGSIIHHYIQYCVVGNNNKKYPLQDRLGPVLGVAKSSNAQKKIVRILSHFFSLNARYRVGLVRCVSLLRLSVLNRNPTCQIPFYICV